MNNKIYSAVIIGRGFGERILLPIFESLNDVKVIGISGRRKSEKKILKYQKNSIKIFNSWKVMINQTNPDIVIIAVPAIDQTKIVTFLIEKNIPFFAEKPLTNNYQNSLKIIKLLSSKETKAVIDYNFIYLPIFIKLKELLDKKRIGRVNRYELIWNFQSYAYKYKKISWRLDNKKGGGTLNHFGSHILSIIDYLFENTKIINSILSKYSKNYLERDDNVFFSSIHKDSVRGNVSICPNTIGINTFALKIYGNKGILEIINDTSDHYKFSGINFYNKENKLKNIFNLEKGNDKKLNSRYLPSRAIAQDLLNYIQYNKNPVANLSFALRIQHLLNEVEKKSTKI